MATNLDLAQRMAEFADALAEFNHLPALAYAVVDRNGTINTRPYLEMFAQPDVGVRAVGEWAQLFGVPVLLDLSNVADGTAEIRTIVTVAGRRTQICQGLLLSQYRAVERYMRIGEVQAGEQVQVTADQLLGAVKDGANT